MNEDVEDTLPLVCAQDHGYECCGCHDHPEGKPWGWNFEAWDKHWDLCPFSDGVPAPESVIGRRWDMFALRYDNGLFYGIGHFRYAQMHGGEPIAVTVTEDSEGIMLGWIDAKRDTPTMIQHERIFEIQFPYGSKRAVERGDGTIVRLTVKAEKEES